MPNATEQVVIEQAFAKLGFSKPPTPNMEGLQALYRAWCLNVPFDNVRKMIALSSSPALRGRSVRTSSEPGGGDLLPGIEPEDFLNAWVEYGTGGTCWPINNALFALMKSAGFDAIRGTGSMWDLGVDNHGTIIVRLDGKDWLVDAALQTFHLLPLNKGEVFYSPDPIRKTEVDPEGDSFYVWSTHPPLPHLLPCRLMDRDVSHELFSSNYERSREISPFNAKLYARRNFDDHLRVLSGNRLFIASANGMTARELSGDELLAEMRDPFGYSQAILEDWVRSGAFDSTMAPTEPPPRPPLTRTPPSERK